MKGGIGDAILVLRRAAGVTQEKLAEAVGITQAALSRYENGMREPDDRAVEALSQALRVTSDLIRHGFRLEGGMAADAHMRRRGAAKPSDWKRVEARLNAARMHSSFLLERISMNPQNHVIQIDPDEHAPEEAAALLRAAWRMPIGPVRNAIRWIESAGVIVIQEDFGTRRIDGMSQWAGDHAILFLNGALPTDRRRWTVAHELGHLALHGRSFGLDAEDQADRFAAAFLMPAHVISPELTNLSLGKVLDLKVEWGVSMQAIFERAYDLGKVTIEDRQRFHHQMGQRGWKAREPGADLLPPEEPELAASISRRLDQSGLTRSEILQLIGSLEGDTTLFDPPRAVLHLV
ncbi:MAG: ImmA/IrrE family metallo-endopeptidase [Bifidobacteriaceae bacterium]|jgi:Zn-dependent peptidase ImmA (M78 family)/transcriptional regulator with XRE-family HTH domain|nr:ImmA/IrrE family metallo-endopeptidase [Bifidobacteriaceae bacterium]